MKRFEEVIDLLPAGLMLDGELVVLGDAGRPLFNQLLFGHRRPTYVAFAAYNPKLARWHKIPNRATAVSRTR